MNIPRFAAIVARIEADPKCWDQSVYHSACGTAHCLFGHAQIDAGKSIDSNSVYRDAMEWLEINYYESVWLCESDRTLDGFKQFLETGRIFDEGVYPNGAY